MNSDDEQSSESDHEPQIKMTMEESVKGGLQKGGMMDDAQLSGGMDMFSMMNMDEQSMTVNQRIFSD